jgi:type IV secretory pathway VirB2 component (pilin)
MGKSAAIVLHVMLIAVVVVGVDWLLFSNRLRERLTVNVGVVLVFAALYLGVLQRP